MEKKLTRDQALIKVIRESAEKDERIAQLEKEKVLTEKRLRKLEEGFRRLSALVSSTEKRTRVLKEKSSSIEHDINDVKSAMRRRNG